MGNVLNYGKAYYATMYADDIHRKTEFEIFHWFGDPTMQIWTDIPQELVVTHSAYLPLGTQEVTINIQRPEGKEGGEVRICLFKESEVFEVSETTGDSVTFTISPIIQGRLYVTVTGHNFVPYEGEIALPYVTAMSPNSGTNDGVRETRIYGFNFCPDMEIKLKRDTEEIPAQNVGIWGIISLICTFDLAGKTPGTYDLIVDGAILKDAFTVTYPVDVEEDTEYFGVVDKVEGWMRGIAIGDPDNDGKSEVYAIGENNENYQCWNVCRDSWTNLCLPGCKAYYNIIIDDVDQDGESEICGGWETPNVLKGGIFQYNISTLTQNFI